MTINKTVVAISWIAGLTAGLFGQGQAQTRLFDGFADGDAFDGNPVSWVPAEQVICGGGVCCRGRYEVDAEGNLNIWDIREGGDLDGGAGMAIDNMRQGDVSVRMHVAAPREGGEIGFFAHLSGCLPSYQAILISGGRMVINRFDGPPPHVLLAEEWLDNYDPDGDYLLQLDIVEELIEFRVWPRDEPIPDEPQLHVRDVTHRRGYLGIYSLNPSPEVPAVVRFFELSDTPIRDTVFRRGDCNEDGKVDIADPVCILNWLFTGVTIGCLAATNTNGDDAANIADATYLLNYLFAGGPVLSHPFPDCETGKLEVDAKLGCETTRCQ